MDKMEHRLQRPEKEQIKTFQVTTRLRRLSVLLEHKAKHFAPYVYELQLLPMGWVLETELCISCYFLPQLLRS